jgi:pyruvate dehydrogenase (quinone)/pyruvate oxidase
MAETAGDVLVDVLLKWGIDTIFGIPGDGVNGIFEALRKRQREIKFIQTRHEEAAAFMACAHAKFTGRIGACIATSGPGGIHLLNGLYDARLDGQPVIAITGMQFHDLTGTHSQQDVELDRLFEDVCVYNERIMGPAHVEPAVDLACRKAWARKGVAHITVPVDFQSMPVSKAQASERNIPHHVSFTRGEHVTIPREEELRKAAEILNTGKKIAILAGRGALGATEELEQVAELLGAPIIKALLGKACVPDESPYTTGGIGLLGTRPSQDAFEECDRLLIVGSAFPYIEFMPAPGQARAVQIDRDPERIGLRYPVEVGLVGDSKFTLEALIKQLKRNENRAFLKRAQNGMRAWNALMKERATRMDKPMKPQVVAAELGQRLPDNAIVTCDSGTITTWWARHIPVKRGQMHSLSGNLATMACGIPYAIAAQIAYPDRPVFAFVGDGGCAMLMAELATVAKYKLPVKIVVIKNNTLGQIKWEQMVFLGNPEYGCELEPIDFAMAARAFGLLGFTVDDPQLCGSVIDEAMRAPGPALIEAVVDPFEPPMPAKVKPEQALHLAESLMRGEPNREKIIATALADKVRELV